MSIWKTEVDLEIVKKRNWGTMVTHMGIEFLEVGPDYLVAKMPVDERTKQPHGIMHGGASCVLAETVGSVAANYCVDLTKEYCVGLEINTSHVKSISSGWVIGTARPLHIGRTTQLWEIRIENEQGQLISMNRLRMATLSREQQ